MPELPEVETVRRVLESKYINRIITKIEVLYPKMIKTNLDEFVNTLTGAKIISIGRKGKYLFINFSNQYSIISHLRMEGKYIQKNIDEENTSYSRVVFYLDNNIKICYDDSRCFGIMYLEKTSEIFSNKEVSKLGPEPFEVKDTNYLYNRIHRSNNEIKACLLDQSIMCGLGNIYCDEVLFKSKINPYKKGKDITLEDCDNILKYSIETLNHAIKLGGSTVSSYHPEKGVDGRFQNELLVYGKVNHHCPNCNSIFRKDRLKGRGTTYCPHCQNVAISVGLTGKIATGKSSVLKILMNKGAKVFSSDDEVNKLYQEIDFQKKIINLFGEAVLNDDLKISKAYIRNIVDDNIELKRKLESLIHPIIKERILNFLQKNKNEKLLVVEVPLLFEAKLSNLFDYTIGVTCSLPSQINHLKQRKCNNIEQSLQINQTSKFDQYANKCDFLINNDGTYEELETQVNQIYQKIVNS